MRTSDRPRKKIAFFEFHDVFEDFYPRYGVTIDDYAKSWNNTGNHAFAALLQAAVGDVVWYVFTLSKQRRSQVHEQTKCRMEVLPAPLPLRLLWHLFYSSRVSWRVSGYYRLYARLASVSCMMSWRLVRSIRQERVDFIVCQDYASGRFDVLSFLGMVFRVPVVARHAGSQRADMMFPLVKRNTLKRAWIVSSSDDLSERLVEEFGVEKRRVRTVLTPIDTERFSPADRDACCQDLQIAIERRYVLFVGRLDDAIKRVSSLMNAFAQWAPANPCWDLLIVGDGQDAPRLKQLAKDLSLTSRIRFFGWVSDVPVRRALYNVAEFLVLPSVSEGFPSVVAESLACGTPVLASHVGGIPQIVRDDDNGWLIPPNDPEQLASRLGALMSAPSRGAAFRRAVRQTALQLVSPASVSRRILDFLSMASR